VLVVVGDGGTVEAVGTYPTMAEAEAAKVTMERADVDIRS